MNKNGNRLEKGEVHRTFYVLSRQIGLRAVGASRGPRLHDFRAEFRDTIEAALGMVAPPVVIATRPPDAPGSFRQLPRGATADVPSRPDPSLVSTHTSVPHRGPSGLDARAAMPDGAPLAAVRARDDDKPTAPCASIEHGPALATALDFCLGGGSRYALQITADQPEVASAIAATAFDRLGDGVRAFVVRADVATQPRRWHPIRTLLRAALSLPMHPDTMALQAASTQLGARARAGLLAVFEDPRHAIQIMAMQRARSMARIWSIARAVKEAVSAARRGPEQIVLWFENVHRYDPDSREVLRVLCAGYVSTELRALLTAAATFDIGIAEGVTRVTWSAGRSPGTSELRL